MVPLRAAIYARVSTPKQQTVPQQVSTCRDRCDHLGYRVRYILKEEGWSAKNTERPQLQRLLQLCASGDVDVIVIWKLDRLVRSLRDLMNLHRQLEAWGVSLHSVTEQFDTSSAFGRFNFRNVASAAELERELIAERARMGKMGQALKGRWPTQRPPLGYGLGKDRTLVVNEEEAAIVKRIFTAYGAEVPLTEIARTLAMEGVVTRMGRTLSTGAIQSIVTNPVYRGELTLLGITHSRPDLRLVDEKTWWAAQARKGKRMQDGKSATRRQAAIDAVFADYLDYLGEGVESPVLGALEDGSLGQALPERERRRPRHRAADLASNLESAGTLQDLEI